MLDHYSWYCNTIKTGLFSFNYTSVLYINKCYLSSSTSRTAQQLNMSFIKILWKRVTITPITVSGNTIKIKKQNKYQKTTCTNDICSKSYAIKANGNKLIKSKSVTVTSFQSSLDYGRPFFNHILHYVQAFLKWTASL